MADKVLHFSVHDFQVVQLMGIDLLRHQAKWKEGLMEIRHHIAGLVQQGFNSNNMKPWKAHWDRQLYKASDTHVWYCALVVNKGFPIEISDIKKSLHVRQMRSCVPLTAGMRTFARDPGQG